MHKEIIHMRHKNYTKINKVTYIDLVDTVTVTPPAYSVSARSV